MVTCMWEHFYNLVETLWDWEFDEVVRKDIAEFSTLSWKVGHAFGVLTVGAFVGGHVDCSIFVDDDKSMSVSEKCLEALCGLGWATPKQVYECLHPSVGSYSSEKKRQAMKAVSMNLLRLADPKRHLVVRRETGKTYAYLIALEGVKRLLYYRSERARERAERGRKAWRQELIKWWNEKFGAFEKLVAVTAKMWENNTELLKRLGSGLMAEYLRSGDGRNVEKLSRRVIALHRTPNSDDLTPQIEALSESARSLLEIGREQAALSERLISLRVSRQKMADISEKEELGKVEPPSGSSWRVLKTFDADANQTQVGSPDGSSWRVLRTLDGDAPARRFRFPSPAKQKEILAALREHRRRSTQIQLYRCPTQIQLYRRPMQIQVYNPTGAF